MKTGGGVSDGFNHRAIGSQDPLKQILAVPGDGEAQNVAVADHRPYLSKQGLGIFDRVAFAQGVAGEQKFLLRRHADCLSGGGTEIAT